MQPPDLGRDPSRVEVENHALHQEVEFLKKQLEMAKQQTLDNKAMCDSLMKSLSKKSSRAESEMASLGQINKYLTGIIEKQDKRILEFENSNDAL